ncbi:MAG: hypothetical protein QOI92_2471, partial [Chloroflexota bacterium]|nr:hypothetical protein [Chloroflexota bacterium]
MRVFRAGLPAIVGMLLLLIGSQSTLSGLQNGRDAMLYGIRSGFIPIAIGIVLLLVAWAIARATRVGFLLGMVTAAAFVVGGLGLTLIEASFASSETFRSIFPLSAILLAIGWTVVWVVYGWRLSKARSTFAVTWGRPDWLVVVGVVAIAIGAVGTHFTLNVLDGSAAAADERDQLQADALIAGTTLTVQVKDATITQETVGTT